MLPKVPVNLWLTLGTCIVLAVFSDSLLGFLTLFFSNPFPLKLLSHLVGETISTQHGRLLQKWLKFDRQRYKGLLIGEHGQSQ